MDNGKPIRGTGYGIDCIDPDGQHEFIEFYTVSEDCDKAFEDYIKSLEAKGFTILDTCYANLA